MKIQENISEYSRLYQKLKNHPMAQHLLEDETHITMIFPTAIRGLNGVRVSKENGKIKAMIVLLQRAEKFWKLDNPVLYPKETL